MKRPENQREDAERLRHFEKMWPFAESLINACHEALDGTRLAMDIQKRLDELEMARWQGDGRDFVRTINRITLEEGDEGWETIQAVQERMARKDESQT